ncbi:MAG: glycosyltransferase [Polyangiaceae bacterium]
MTSILFASEHPLVDPSNGASRTMRTFLRVLVEAGWTAATCDGGRHGMPDATSGMGAVFERAGVAVVSSSFGKMGARATIRRARVDGIEVTNVTPETAGRDDSPPPHDVANWFAVYDAVLRARKPDVVVTYGGGPTGRRLLRMARERGARTAFALFNTNYRFADLFDNVDRTLVPADFMRRHYRELLDLDPAIVRDPVDARELEGAPDERRYLTFVSPVAAKGAGIAARLFEVLARKRPDIPCLVVEGRATIASRDQFVRFVGPGANVSVMPTTKDPRHFLAKTKMLLMPSLAEPSGRTAAEAMILGIPVLAANTGGLVETVADGGFLVDLPPRFVPGSELVATPEEVEPWLRIVERSWDDPAFFADAVERARAARGRLELGAVKPDIVSFFESVRTADARPVVPLRNPKPEGKLPKIPVVETAVKRDDAPETRTSELPWTEPPEFLPRRG